MNADFGVIAEDDFRSVSLTISNAHSESRRRPHELVITSKLNDSVSAIPVSSMADAWDKLDQFDLTQGWRAA